MKMCCFTLDEKTIKRLEEKSLKAELSKSAYLRKIIKES